MASQDEARRIYEQSIVIDGLNISNWNSPSVYESLHAGRVTAINATIAVWEGFGETLDHIASWLGRFNELSIKIRIFKIQNTIISTEF